MARGNVCHEVAQPARTVQRGETEVRGRAEVRGQRPGGGNLRPPAGPTAAPAPSQWTGTFFKIVFSFLISPSFSAVLTAGTQLLGHAPTTIRHTFRLVLIELILISWDIGFTKNLDMDHERKCDF